MKPTNIGRDIIPYLIVMAASITCFFSGIMLFSLLVYMDVHGPALLPDVRQFIVFLCCWSTGVGLLGLIRFSLR